MAIHSLRPEFRPDNARNQVRASQTLARRLYVFGLSAGALWVVYLFIGSLVLLDASGLVVQDREIVTQPFDAQVLSFAARPGQKVVAGQELGNVVSTQMLDLISSLITGKAQIEARETQIAKRLAAIETTLPSAESRSRTAKAAQAQIEKAVASGFSTQVRQAEATRDAYDAVREVEALRSESSALESERGTAKLNLAHLAVALERAQATYREGIVVTPVGGTLGAKVAEPGAVLTHGEIMADVYHGAKYVLAYLPTNRLYGIAPGQRVIVTDGVNRESGRVERIETITDRTPAEFQSNLSGVDRNQVARIVFDEPTQFPLMAKIKVTGPYGLSNLIDGARWAMVSWRSEATTAPRQLAH
ncbi:HlyD family secretion protein [Rhodoblastus sp.]|uniref:HlyD family secretion protein n=1 Tax=Rhodoblastus sp. TaxID=1962975 RepID=UPI0035AFADFB